MEEIPTDIKEQLFKYVNRKEYSALASSSREFTASEKRIRPIINTDLDSQTSFIGKYHLTTYHTKMISHLMASDTPTYVCIPDTWNLCVIALIYAYVSEKPIAISKLMRTVIAGNWQDVLRKIDHIPHLTDNDTSVWNSKLPTIKVGDVTLYTGHPALNNNKDAIHPSYADEQVHKVWQSTDYIYADAMPKGKILRDITEPISLQTIKKYDIFILHDIPELAYDIFSQMSQHFPEKMLIVTGTNPMDYDTGLHTGVLSLPFKFFLEEDWIPLGSVNSYSSRMHLSYAEILIKQHYLLKNEKNVEDKISVLYSWLDSLVGDTPIRVVEGELNLAQERQRSDDNSVRPLYMRIGYRDVSEDRNKRYADYDDKWALIDPQANIADVPVKSAGGRGFKTPEDVARELLLETLRRSIESNSRKGTYTVAELKAIAKEHSVKLTSKDTKKIIAAKILSSLE